MIKPSVAVITLAISFVIPQLSNAQSNGQTNGSSTDQVTEKPRARELGIAPGIFETGARNSITDVGGVLVGQATVVEANRVNTGVTAILPHDGNLYEDRVPAAIVVGNGYGKLLGVTQVAELGELETPVLLTCTLCVWKAADAMVEWMLAKPGMENVRSINPVVGETNDGYLNDIRSRPISSNDVVDALESASVEVEEGSIGAGRGTIAFSWKGGIGTSSRVLPETLGGYTVGVLVQSNYGGILTIAGAPIGEILGTYAFKNDVGTSADGSIMIVVATDAPLDSRLLERLGTRALTGLARTGSSMTNGSGDYVIAFSTETTEDIVPNSRMSGLFQAVAEAVEEAIYNSMFAATSVEGPHGVVDPVPVDSVMEIIRSGVR